MKPKFEIGQEIYKADGTKDKIIKIYEIKDLTTKKTFSYLYETKDIIPLMPEGILLIYNKQKNN